LKLYLVNFSHIFKLVECLKEFEESFAVLSLSYNFIFCADLQTHLLRFEISLVLLVASLLNHRAFIKLRNSFLCSLETKI